VNCPNCKTEKRPHGRCCAEEIARLRKRLLSVSKYIERLEDRADRLERERDRLEDRDQLDYASYDY